MNTSIPRPASTTAPVDLNECLPNLFFFLFLFRARGQVEVRLDDVRERVDENLHGRVKHHVAMRVRKERDVTGIRLVREKLTQQL